MPAIRTALLLVAAATFALALAACGASNDSEEYDESSASFGLDAPGFPGAPGAPAAMMSRDTSQESAKAQMAQAPAAAMPTAAPALPAPSQPQAAVVVDEEAKAADDGAPVASLVAQQRIIVRTVDLALVVSDVSAAIEDAGALAERLGGWVVSSEHSRKHAGSVTLRVPADSLDDAIDSLRAMAVEIDHEIATSQDVTDEYVDLNSRLRNLDATEQALLSLLEKADKVEDALAVQRELTFVQEQVEVIQGRVKYLEQTAAYSLVNVYFRLAPAEMGIDGGADRTASVGELARFRATFTPPEGIDEFSFTWDFGDGSEKVYGSRVAPTVGGEMVTATVAHVYDDERDSPYIATVELTGSGEAGVAEGSDTVIVSVTRIPKIEVFAGESFSVTEGEEFEVSGSFTRPAGLTDVSYRWDFGDGSEPVSGELGEGETTALATHTYDNHRPTQYTVTLTITAKSDAGDVEARAESYVYVRESLGWTVGGWNMAEQWKSATRALSGLAQALGTLLIWAVIFSPVWLIIAAVIWYLVRRARRYQAGRQPPADAPTPEEG